MSDILIRGMKLPIFEHQSWDICHGDDGKWYIVDTNAETSDGGWHEIISVPSHGDLIDRNVLYHNMFIGPDGKVFPDRDVDNFPHEMRFEDIKRFIRKAQTVIQTSE